VEVPEARGGSAGASRDPVAGPARRREGPPWRTAGPAASLGGVILGLALVLRVLAVVDGAAPAGDLGAVPAVLLVGLLGVATVAAFAGVVHVVLTLLGLSAAVPAPALGEPAGLRLRVFARDPDARGHVRSRAPGAVLPAA